MAATTRTSSPARPARLRAWQQEALDRLADWQGGPFLISACPGAGKTRPALELARDMLERRAIEHVVVTCPTTPLTRQWASAAAGVGLQLVPDSERPRPPRGFQGVAVTYARVAGAPRSWAAGAGPGTLVIADEAHHLGEDLAWGSGFQQAFAASSRWLLLSGTPFRSDATPIPGVSYDREGLAVPDVSYDYADAVREGVCRPVAFVTFDGTLSWRSGEDVIESSFDTVLPAREAARRYRTAISTDLPEGLPRILAEAHARLGELRRSHPEAGGLVVAADSVHARQIAALLREATGTAPVVVLHTEAGAAAKLAAFTRSRDPWIVAVNMVSEGVDIPRLRVGVYATAAKTPLVFRQIVGRFVRALPGRSREPSWLYLPADPVLRSHAEQIETELRQVRRREEIEQQGFEEPSRRESERTEPVDFEPLTAAFEAQMTLFGPAPGSDPAQNGTGAPALAGAAAASAILAAPARTPDTGLALPEPPEQDMPEPPVAAFERRADLRAERSRLVADLHRRDGRSHREINAWLNRSIGIDRVDKASIAQLERSVALLVKELGRARR